MKRIILLIILTITIVQPANSLDFSGLRNDVKNTIETRSVKRLLKSQVRYANKNDFEKFISTYDEKYTNGDGFNLDVYSTMVKDLWNLYNGIKYSVEFKDVKIDVYRQVMNNWDIFLDYVWSAKPIRRIRHNNRPEESVES